MSGDRDPRYILSDAGESESVVETLARRAHNDELRAWFAFSPAAAERALKLGFRFSAHIHNPVRVVLARECESQVGEA